VITTTSLLIRERERERERERRLLERERGREREQRVVPFGARMRWTGWGHDGMSVTCVGNRSMDRQSVVRAAR